MDHEIGALADLETPDFLGATQAVRGVQRGPRDRLVDGQTRRQAQTVANTVILVLSALGGSMVPRFLMPAVLKDLGWLTPNTWALEAYSGVFWRGDPLTAVWLPVALLFTVGIAGWLIARTLAHRRAYGD